MPKQLPVSLEVLNLGEYSDNTNKFTGGIPSDWGALTNLKELKMVACGLDGAICMPHHTTYHTTDWLLIWLLLRVLTLQVPDGAPTDEDGDMDYNDREEVAAFQACLK